MEEWINRRFLLATDVFKSYGIKRNKSKSEVCGGKEHTKIAIKIGELLLEEVIR